MVFYMADGTTISTAPKFTGSSYLDTASGNVGTILGVDDEDMPIIHELLRVWREKYPRQPRSAEPTTTARNDSKTSESPSPTRSRTRSRR